MKGKPTGGHRMPPPGLDGTYTQTCIACFQGTDTALGCRGEAAWHAAFLMNLGVPEDQAWAVVEDGPGSSDEGWYDAIYRVCAGCVERSAVEFPSPVLALEGAPLPTIVQPR